MTAAAGLPDELAHWAAMIPADVREALTPEELITRCQKAVALQRSARGLPVEVAAGYPDLIRKELTAPTKAMAAERAERLRAAAEQDGLSPLETAALRWAAHDIEATAR